jgi:hypothetical protein
MSQLEQAIARIEDHFRVCQIEYAHVFNTEGDLLHYFRGSKDYVKFEGNHFGRIFTHNHPNGGSFSAGDLCTMIQQGFREIRAYGLDGVYSLKVIGEPVRRELEPGAEKAWAKAIKKDPLAVEKFAEKYGMEYTFQAAPEGFLEKNRAAQRRRKG